MTVWTGSLKPHITDTIKGEIYNAITKYKSVKQQLIEACAVLAHHYVKGEIDNFGVYASHDDKLFVSFGLNDSDYKIELTQTDYIPKDTGDVDDDI